MFVFLTYSLIITPVITGNTTVKKMLNKVSLRLIEISYPLSKNRDNPRFTKKGIVSKTAKLLNEVSETDNATLPLSK